MTQLDCLRAWITVFLLLLGLALLPASALLEHADLATERTLQQCFPDERQPELAQQAQTWAAHGWWLTQRVVGEPDQTAKAAVSQSAPAATLVSLPEAVTQAQRYLHIVCLRLALLHAFSPTFGLLLLAALVDGWIARRVRQASFQPSSALLHRLALLGISASFWLLASYLLMPIPWPWWWLLGLALVCLLSARVLLAETQKRL